MKINFDAQLFDQDDALIMEDGKPAAVSKALKRAVIAFEDKDKKLELFELFLKLKAADSTTDFSIEEIALLDKAISVFPTLIYGQLSYLLAGK